MFLRHAQYDDVWFIIMSEMLTSITLAVNFDNIRRCYDHKSITLNRCHGSRAM